MINVVNTLFLTLFFLFYFDVVRQFVNGKEKTSGYDLLVFNWELPILLNLKCYWVGNSWKWLYWRIWTIFIKEIIFLTAWLSSSEASETEHKS